MKSFLMNSACSGHRPKKAGRRRRYTRPRLMKRMMEERHVVRILTAPQGFGKTALAAEYAESIFGFVNVFWIDCHSPCFLRDLDEGAIATTLQGAATESSLVIFEDVPYLDDGRAQALSSAFDTLLTCGWEVVATTLPPFNSFAERQPDCLTLEAPDFLVLDDEVNLAVEQSRLLPQARVERVASLVWGEDEEREVFYRSLRGEELPPEMRLAMLTMLIMEDGDLDEVTEFVRGFKRDAWRFLARHYPHLGIDLVSETFYPVTVPVDLIAGAYKASMEYSTEKAGFLGRDAYSTRLADLLVSKGGYRRACEIMKSLCARKRRMPWIERHGATFLESGQIAPLQNLFDSLGARPTGLSPRCLTDAAVRLCLLEEREAAARMALRTMAHPDASPLLVCEAALVGEECGSEELRKRATRILQRAATPVIEGTELPDDEMTILRHLAASRLQICKDPLQAVRYLLAIEEAIPQSIPARYQIIYLLNCASGRTSVGAGIGSRAWLREARESLCALALRCANAYTAIRSDIALLDAMIMDALAPLVGDVTGSMARRRGVDDLMMSLTLQRQEWAARTKPALPPNSEPAKSEGQAAPEMRVRLFGGMEVRIGGKVVAPEAFRKQKAKTLLAILVLHRGYEVPRQELLDIMWPSSTADRAVANFYSLWSVLRRAVSTPDGQCPYLVRNQTSCMVDLRYVHSDIEELEAICRMLIFDTLDTRIWMDAYERLSGEFFCDLLPSETDNHYIVGMRAKYRARTVDACVVAANRLCDAGEVQTALWFAHSSLELDKHREDVYHVLIRAQHLSGRRTSAMETYFAYLKFIGEELGMEPSSRIVNLYNEMLTCSSAAC